MRATAFCAVFIILWVVSACSEKTEYPENFADPRVNFSPGGWVDKVAYGEGKYTASGWAADNEDGAPVARVAVYVDNKLLGYAKLGIERSDVAEATKSPWRRSGWQIEAQVSLTKGAHKTFAVAYDSMGAFAMLPCGKAGRFETEVIVK